MKIILVLFLYVNTYSALVQAMYNEVNPSTGGSVTLQSPSTAGNLLIFVTRPSDGTDDFVVTAGGETFTKVTSEPGASTYGLSVYALWNAPSITTVTQTGGDTSDQQRMSVVEFSGVATSGTVIEDFNSGSGFAAGGVLNAGNVDTLTDNTLLVMIGATDSDEFHSVPVPSEGWNLIDWDGPSPPNLPDGSDPDKSAIMWKVAGSIGNYGGTMDDDQDPIWSAIIVSFKSTEESEPEPSLNSHSETGSVTRTGSMTRRQL